MFGLSEREREAKKRAHNLHIAETMQFGVWKNFDDAFAPVFGDRSAVAAAGISNYIFRFGVLGETIGSNVSDKEFVMNALNMSYEFCQKGSFRSEITVGVILSASGLQIPRPFFDRYVRLLYNQALIDVGPMTPDIRKFLPKNDYYYYNNVCQISISICCLIILLLRYDKILLI